MKLSKTLVIPAAALLLVGAAGAVLATSAPSADHSLAGAAPAAQSSPAAPGTGSATKPHDPFLTGVLDKLVAKGTITSAQESAIIDAIDAARAGIRADRQEMRQLIHKFLTGGTVTQADVNQFPAGSRLREVAQMMADGKITPDQLRDLRALFGGRAGLRPDAPAAPAPGAGGAAPSPSATTSG